MRSFKNIARLIRTKRIGHPKNYPQVELSVFLGYKNGQFISNVERGFCSVPLKKLKKIAEILDIGRDELKAAIMRDHEEMLTNYFNISTTAKKAA